MVEGVPIPRCEEVGILGRVGERRRQADHRFAAAPGGRRTEGVAGGDEHGRTVESEAALSPAAATLGFRRPSAEHPGLGQIEPNHHAVVGATVPEVAGIRDVELAVDQRQRAALPLGPVVEASAQRVKPVLDVDRPARRHLARGERKAEHLVARTAGGRLDDRFQINDP